MSTPYVILNTVCCEPNTGAHQHECEQQSNRTELRSEKFLYEKSKLLDLGRSAILPISRKVLHNLCNYGLSKHNHFNTHAGPFKRPRGKRGGRRKQRKIKVQLTQRFFSSSTNFNIGKVSYGNLQTICTYLVEQERTKYLRIGYFNAQSCRNKTEENFDLIIEKNIDILLITETWLAQHGDDVTIQNLTPPYFICKSFPRPNRRSGGIPIIYKNNLQRKLQIKLNLSFDHTSFEAAEFSINQGYNFFQVICIYRPPYSGSNKLSPAVFINEFEQLLCSLSSRSRHTIILGEIKLHFDSDSSNDVNRMKDLPVQYGTINFEFYSSCWSYSGLGCCEKRL